MIRNYLKVAWRNIVKNPFYASVNIVGLAAGIAFTLLISAYVWGELQVNKQLKNAAGQFIIESNWKNPGAGYPIATFGPLGKALKENYPTLVENYYRYDGVTTTVSRGEKSFKEGVQIGDSTFFAMYGFDLEKGDVRTAFNSPYSVVISKELAKKYFGNEEPIGQTLRMENFTGARKDFMVTGVLSATGRNSITHLVDEFPNHIYIAGNNLDFFGRAMEWNNPYIVNFIQLKPGVKPSDLEKPIRDIVKTNAPPDLAAMFTSHLTSLESYYLDANDGLVRKLLYALSAIACFILAMAVINFVNMSISRSSTRMREIGIRKVMGGVRKQLIIQFLIESILLVFISTLIAIALFLLSRDLFGSIIGREIPALRDFPVYFIFLPVALVLFTGLIAGIYPAFVLSAMQSVNALKGKLSQVKENILLRRGLVAFQFGTAVIVFAGAIIISQQVKLFFSKDLGYDKEYMIAAQVPRDWSANGVKRMEGIRQQLSMLPQVSNVSLSFEIPDGNNSGSFPIRRSDADSSSAIISQLLYSDEYYAATYNIPMAAGEFFSAPGALTDSNRIVINETQSRMLGWSTPSDAIHQQLRFQDSPTLFTIAGVTKDFHFGSMQKTIQPVTFVHVGASNTFRFFSIRLKPGAISNSLSEVQKKWASLMPGAPFEYRFIDETLNRLYKSELQLKRASVLATVLSILIVLLGVIGLISLSLQKRTREIGIRKVLGASVPSIISLFVKEFIWVILLAGAIACPIAWYIMQGWLSDYAYRITPGPLPFIASVAGLTFITMLVIIFRTYRAGWANPVQSLRTE